MSTTWNTLGFQEQMRSKNKSRHVVANNLMSSPGRFNRYSEVVKSMGPGAQIARSYLSFTGSWWSPDCQ